jgi:LmbE family N-acetylglucosaminyl deacetylase
VRVVYLTYGDHNEWAFLMYRHSPFLTPGVNRAMGKTRRLEAERAMAGLGLKESDLAFLGFPDNGTLAIWSRAWGERPPLHSLLTDSRFVFYPDAVAYLKPYKGEEILAALQQQVSDFKPTRVLVPLPIDSNPDHRAYYLYLQIVLWNLEGKIPPPAVYCYPIHMGAWPRPLNYHPDEWLVFPALLKADTSPWWIFELTPEEVTRKAEAIRTNKSQMADHGYWLVSLARKNELFTTPSPIYLNRSQWNLAHGVVPHAGTDAYETGVSTGHLTAVTFSTDADALLVQFHLKHRQRFGLSFYAFGYRHDKDFPQMPKLRFIWQWGLLRMEDNGVTMPLNGSTAERNKEGVLLSVPWVVLGDPERLLVQAHGLAGDVPVSETGWQILLR